jgi:hypothetical protein
MSFLIYHLSLVLERAHSHSHRGFSPVIGDRNCYWNRFNGFRLVAMSFQRGNNVSRRGLTTNTTCSAPVPKSGDEKTVKTVPIAITVADHRAKAAV